MQHSGRGFPASVEVLSTERAPVVPVDHPVWVQERYYFENEVVSESFGFWSIADQKLDHALHHPRRIALTRVHPCTDEDSLLGQSFCTLGIFVFARDSEVLASVASQRARQSTPVVKVCRVTVFFDFVQVILQIRVGIREAVREELLVVVVSEFDCESQGVVGFGVARPSFFLEFVLVVNNAFAYSVPACALFVLQLVREAQDLHAIVVQGVWFGQVNYIKSDFLALAGVADSEEVPLRVAVGIDVILEDEVVLVVVELDGC